MKVCVLVMGILLIFNGNVFGNDTFMHPSSWGISTGDSHNSHYNTFEEDDELACFLKSDGTLVNESLCDDKDGRSPEGYVWRDCGYGGHCSTNNSYHGAIDYDIPNHLHDPADNGKTTGLRQGKNVSLDYHGNYDDIVASNYGKVKDVYNGTDLNHGFGKMVILRHICDPNTPNLQSLCVQEGDDWVIYSQYSHMSRVVVSTGQLVNRGQKIGEIGGTGGWIHHLHYEMKTKPVYDSPIGSYRGYTPADPTNFGYRNPFDFIGKVKVIEYLAPVGNDDYSCIDNKCWVPGNVDCPAAQVWFEIVGDDSEDRTVAMCDNLNSNSPQIFTEGNHTHIIADDYRCSKETNGPILCWEDGGNTNCWNAHKWYQMTCDVEEVPVLRGDSDYTMALSRDFTCNEVYNSGTNTSTGGDLGGTSYGTGNGTGNGYHNDQGDPWAGYVHHVGLRYLKIGKKSSGHWKGSKVWALSQIPNKRDFRVKLKRKGGKWTNVCAEIWFSHNKHFTDDDLYLGKECKKLSKKKYRKKKKKSVYVKNISIPKMEAGKNYYFFTRVTYDGGVNVSDDSDEYVKVEIADVSSKFKVDEVFGEIPFTVNFTNKSKAVFGYITSYHWNFGDGSTSSEANPTHTYTQAGAFTVQLTTTANWGEQKTSSATVVANNPVPDPPVDTDNDGITDDNESGDTDNDGLANWEESFLSDADNDGVNDQLDAENFNPANDSDNDGFTNEEEKIAGTNPLDNNSFPDIVEEDNSNLQDSCQETAETATNGGWGWNPITEQGCLVNYYQDSGSDENDSEDYCHETADTPTNGGWGWNPVTQEGCLVVVDSNASNEDNCEPTADTDTNGGWGWNSITEQGCLVSGGFDETEDDTTINPDDSENYCHETSDTPTNGGWGWNPVIQEGCLVNP